MSRPSTGSVRPNGVAWMAYNQVAQDEAEYRPISTAATNAAA